MGACFLGDLGAGAGAAGPALAVEGWGAGGGRSEGEDAGSGLSCLAGLAPLAQQVPMGEKPKEWGVGLFKELLMEIKTKEMGREVF